MNKLGGFGPVYVINLQRRTDRREHMDRLFKSHGVTDYTFIDAIDAKDNIDDLIYNPRPPHVRKARQEEIAGCMSHLKAIKYWLDTSDSEYAIFAEDDLSMDTVEHWRWTWQEFIDAIKFDYDVLQLCLTQFRSINYSMHRRLETDYSAGLYILKREHAKKVIDKMIIDNKYNVNIDKKYVIVDHSVIFGYTNNSYSCALFTYDISMESDINPRGQRIHSKSRNSVLNFWKSYRKTLQEFVDIK